MHHLFGAEVSKMVRAAYGDAFLTAHLEVSRLAMAVTACAAPLDTFWPSWPIFALYGAALPVLASGSIESPAAEVFAGAL